MPGNDGGRSIPLPDIEAEIHYLSTDNGGRKGYVASDYRGQFFYDGHDWDARQYFIGKSQVEPGETVNAQLAFLSPHEHVGKVAVGTMFLVREGAKTVGYGKVTRLLNLLANANRMGEDSGSTG
jgi:translation elongation factor EF-Tu-like GTPase